MNTQTTTRDIARRSKKPEPPPPAIPETKRSIRTVDVTTVPTPARSTTARNVSAMCLLAAAVLWVVSLPQVDPELLDDLGIVSILPWTSWTAVALVLVGFVLSLGPRTRNGLLPALNLSVLILILHATPAIAYGTLRYSWAWKHLGIIDYIQRHAALDPVAPFLAAYHNWPGFFIAGATIADLFDLGSLEMADVARFSPPVLNLLLLCTLPAIYSRLTSDPRLLWTAVLIFLVGNWVGQDYFSPQGATYLLYLIIVALCLGPLQPQTEPVPIRVPGKPRATGAGWLASSHDHLRGLVQRGEPGTSQTSTVFRAMAVVSMIVLTGAIVTSHQLTPLVLMTALAGLILVTRLNVGFLVIVVLANALWVLYFAAPFAAAMLPSELAAFGEALDHLTGNLVDPAIVSPGQAWVVLVSRLLTAAIAVAAVLGGLRRLWAGHRDGAAAVLTLAPLPILVATSYGGEAIFRVFLFALPFLAFFAAALFFPTSGSGRSGWVRALLAVTAMVLTVGFFLANNGKDRQYRFSPYEVEAATWLYGRAPPGSLLVEGARNYPSQFMNYENFSYVPIAVERPEHRAEIENDPAGVLGRWLTDSRWTDGYVIITRSQKAYIDTQGVMEPGALHRIEQALLASPRFQLVHATPHSRIFQLATTQRPVTTTAPTQ